MADQARPNSQPERHGDSPIILDPGYRFLAPAVELRVSPSERGAGSLAVSLVAHAAVCLVAIAVAGRAPVSPTPEARPPAAMPLVWTPTLEAGGRDPGGGGKEDERTPATPAQLVGPDALTVPVSPPVQLNPPKPQVADPTPRLDIPVMPVQAGLQEVVGAVAELRPIVLTSRGPGTGPGADGGRGRGIDGGDGDRLGDADGPGEGGEGWRPGNGVTWPRLVREVKPNYTPDAMRAQVEGMVELDILVLADGSVGRVNIVRSLDARFGLDQEAINAVRRWRFDPGRRLGKAVATRVAVELSFNLR
jgi:protein TonB